MNSIHITRFRRSTTAQSILDASPLLVTGTHGFVMRVSKCFSLRPEFARMMLTDAKKLSEKAWGKLLASGPIVVSVYGSPWFLVEAWGDDEPLP